MDKYINASSKPNKDTVTVILDLLVAAPAIASIYKHTSLGFVAARCF